MLKYISGGYSFIFLDETGLNIEMIRPKKWQLVGNKTEKIIMPIKGKNITLLAAVTESILLAYMFVKGGLKS